MPIANKINTLESLIIEIYPGMTIEEVKSVINQVKKIMEDKNARKTD